MVLESALLIGGALLTAAVGVPIATRLARPASFGRYAPRDAASTRKAAESHTAFEPLDLGPDPMVWPSEIKRESLGIPDRPWPSQTWDDPQFGAHWKKHRPHADGGGAPAEAAQASSQPVEVRRRERAQQEQAARAAPPAERPGTRAERAKEQVREKVEAHAEQVRRRVETVVREEVAEARQEVVGAARQQAQQVLDRAAAIGATGAPSAAEIEALVGRVGLAGTVQEIMGRTGWDFRQAAQYLAKARQGG